MAESGKRPRQLFQEGVDARDRGKAATACPYPAGGDDREYWLEGWHERDSPDEYDDADK